MLALAMTVSMASAWEKRPDEGVFLLAKKHMSPEAKSVVEKYLGESYADDVFYLRTLEQKKQATHSKELRFLHLTADFKSAGVEGEDALKGIEQSLAVVRARDSYSTAEVRKALRTIINLMCDMHNFGYVRIEGIPQSQANFTFTCYGGDYGKRKTTAPYKWERFWDLYTHWHGGFSGDLWAEDMELCHGGKYAEFTKGSLSDWATDNGAKAAGYLAYIYPDSVITLRDFLEMDCANYDMVARAGFRLAELLNDAIK